MNEVIFAIRRLRKHPQQLPAGILAFMLGIGLNTAMYSIADVILFRPLELKSLDRLAMGAQPVDILGLLGRQAFVMTASGILVGLISSDFWSLSSGTLVLVAVAALAIYFPARRAIHMDPATALRHD